MTTKERIVQEALTLFSQKGYQGTSVKNIADAVGIKDSSLYKHFASKQEILEAIMQTMLEHVRTTTGTFGIPIDADLEQAGAFFAAFDQDALVAFSRRIFLFYLKDEMQSKFWRMGMMEQFRNEQVHTLYSRFFLQDSIQYQATLFAELIRQGIFIQADPQMLAVRFYAPIFFLFNKYAGVEGGEAEALHILDQQVIEFYKAYHKER